MPIELIIPPLGESISEAVVAKWLKPVGAKVNVDDPLAELETDKVTVTLPPPGAADPGRGGRASEFLLACAVEMPKE